MLRYEDFLPEIKQENLRCREERFNHILSELNDIIASVIGSITVVTGPMNSGKSSFFYKLKKHDFERSEGKIFHYFKPELDDRQDNIYSRDHENEQINSIRISQSLDIFDKIKDGSLVPEESVICIDEVQFCDSNIIDVIEYLRFHRAHVILCGLDTDFTGNSFELQPVNVDTYNANKATFKELGLETFYRLPTMGDIMAVANLVVKVCARNESGIQATHSMKLGAKSNDQVVETGDKDKYLPTTVEDHQILQERISDIRLQFELD